MIFSCAFSLVRAQTYELVNDPNAPIIKFDSLIGWFDTVYQGSIVDHEFHFTNKGKTPLLISGVTGSSGSVCPSYPKEPIGPGKSGIIRVVFHTGGKMGPQDKCVTVTSNATEPMIVLHIRGYVILPQPPSPRTAAKISFDTTVYDFGTVAQGDTAYHEFHFKNTGTEPLIVSSAIGTGGGCRCVGYPDEPIPPNASGLIKVEFITVGKSGAQDKTVTINSNSTGGPIVIHMMGTIVAKSK